MSGARVKADIHGIANEIFGAIVWGAQQPPPPYGAAYPSYTRYGNSDAETEARVIAARILAALEPDPDIEALVALCGFYFGGLSPNANSGGVYARDILAALKGCAA